MPKGKGTYGSKVGRPPKKFKKYPHGGMLEGAQHEEGGIAIEAEGGEYIVKSDSVNEGTLPVLELINELGSFPMSNAMGRSQVFRDDEE